jgi:hypothetical protein
MGQGVIRAAAGRRRKVRKGVGCAHRINGEASENRFLCALRTCVGSVESDVLVDAEPRGCSHRNGTLNFRNKEVSARLKRQ